MRPRWYAIRHRGAPSARAVVSSSVASGRLPVQIQRGAKCLVQARVVGHQPNLLLQQPASKRHVALLDGDASPEHGGVRDSARGCDST